MSAAAESPLAHQCASCGEPATLACAACKHTPADFENDTPTIYYCKKGCQASDWNKHKSECKARVARRSIYRAAEMALKIYLEFCFQTWGERVIDVEDDGHGLHIKGTRMGAHILYHPFPSMPNFNDEDRAAVAVHSNCNVGMKVMWEVVKALFEGQDVGFLEVRCRVLNCPRETFLVPGGGSMSYMHVFWALKLNLTGDVYYLDLSSAQFGHYKPLTRPEEYQEKIKLEIHRTDAGGHERYDKENMKKDPDDETRVFYRDLGIAHGDAVLARLRAWEKDNLTMARLLRLPQSDYDGKATNLVESCKIAISKSIQDFHDNGTLVQRHGMTLLKHHEWTKQHVHPFRDKIYEQQPEQPPHPSIPANLTMSRLALEFEKMMSAEFEEKWTEKRFQDLTQVQKDFVEKELRYRPIEANDRVSCDGTTIKLRTTTGRLIGKVAGLCEISPA